MLRRYPARISSGPPARTAASSFEKISASRLETRRRFHFRDKAIQRQSQARRDSIAVRLQRPRPAIPARDDRLKSGSCYWPYSNPRGDRTPTGLTFQHGASLGEFLLEQRIRIVRQALQICVKRFDPKLSDNIR